MKYVTALLEGLWGLYAWGIFLIGVALSLIVVTIMPNARARSAFAGFASRTAFLLSGVKVDVIGLENLPPGHSVVVANHAS